MGIAQVDATQYLGAAIGCLRSMLEVRGLPPSLRADVERKKVDLEHLRDRLAALRGRRWSSQHSAFSGQQ